VDHQKHNAAELLGSIEAAGKAQAAVGGEGHAHGRAVGGTGRRASAWRGGGGGGRSALCLAYIDEAAKLGSVLSVEPELCNRLNT
jgi:hypothetical protein